MSEKITINMKVTERFATHPVNAGSPAIFILSCVYGDTRQRLDGSQLTPRAVSALFPAKRSAGGRRCVVHTDKKPGLA